MLKKIKEKDLELCSFIILLLWTISPIIEYIFKESYYGLYTHYFTNTTYFIGIVGIAIYIVYLIKFKKKEKIKFNNFIPEIFLIILLIISVIASILSKDPHMSFFGESYRKEGLVVYLMYIGFILSASIIKDSKYIKYIFKSMIAICLIITISPIFRIDFSYFNFANIFHNSNHYGYYLMLNTMLALSMFIHHNKLLEKIIYMLIYIFFLYLLIRNDTFGSYLAVLATIIFLLVYFMIKKYKRIDIILVIIVFIATSFAVSNYDIKFGEKIHLEDTRGIILNNFILLRKDIKDITDNDGKIKKEAGSYRIVLWQEAWKYSLDHPVFGGGMECLKFYYIKDRKEFYNKYNDRPHNSILQVSSFIGIPGAIIYLAFIIYVAITNLIKMNKDTIHIMIYSTAMCYFLSSLLGNSMYYTSPYFMILLGLLIGFNRRINRLAKS